MARSVGLSKTPQPIERARQPSRWSTSSCAKVEKHFTKPAQTKQVAAATGTAATSLENDC